MTDELFDHAARMPSSVSILVRALAPVSRRESNEAIKGLLCWIGRKRRMRSTEAECLHRHMPNFSSVAGTDYREMTNVSGRSPNS